MFNKFVNIKHKAKSIVDPTNELEVEVKIKVVKNV